MVNGGAPPVGRRLHYAVCGEVTGVFERVAVEREKGTLHPASLRTSSSASGFAARASGT